MCIRDRGDEGVRFMGAQFFFSLPGGEDARGLEISGEGTGSNAIAGRIQRNRAGVSWHTTLFAKSSVLHLGSEPFFIHCGTNLTALRGDNHAKLHFI